MEKLKIFYDSQIFSFQLYGGISRYFTEIMKVYDGMSAVDYHLGVSVSNNHYLHNTYPKRFKYFLKNFSFPQKKNVIFMINQMKERKAVVSRDFDIFHPTYYNPYFLKRIGDKPFVLTIHDMIHEIFPQYFSRRDCVPEYKRKLALKAKRIIAVSQNTKDDIVRFYNINPNKIDVIYHGASLGGAMETFHWIPKKYFLYVGQRGIYKNFDFFLQSVVDVLKEDPELYVICAGGGNFNQIEKNKLKAINAERQVLYFPVMSDSSLIALYSHAVAFVFPSSYEGFGIPIAEAFSCKTPVVLSKASCFPEVAGNAGIYFDLENPDSLKNCLFRVLNDDDYRNEKINEGTSRLKDFSWESAAKKTLSTYQKSFCE